MNFLNKHILFSIFIFISTVSMAQEKKSLLETLTKTVKEKLDELNEEEKLTPKRTTTTKPAPKPTKRATTTTRRTRNVKNSETRKTPRLTRNSVDDADDYPEIEIPVVFHVVHKFIGEADIPKRRFIELIEYMNRGFKAENQHLILPYYKSRIGNPKIKFYNPEFAYDENCNKKDGITFHSTTEEYFEHKESFSLNYNLKYDESLKSNGYINSKKYLNIWICNIKGKIRGYSSFPKESNKYNDGIVMDIAVFFNDLKKPPKTRTDPEFIRIITSHEIGHYFGLEHIWGRGRCNDINQSCYTSRDDNVEDTPRQKCANELNFYGNNNELMQRDCDDPDMFGNYQNYMDYSYNVGMFTKGQVKRMRDQIEKYRPGLLIKNQCPDQSLTTTKPYSTQTNSQNQSAYADVCFANHATAPRKIVLTHRNSGVSKEIIMDLGQYRNPKISCAYQIENGVYRVQSFSTRGNLKEDFEINLRKGENPNVKLTASGW